MVRMLERPGREKETHCHDTAGDGEDTGDTQAPGARQSRPKERGKRKTKRQRDFEGKKDLYDRAFEPGWLFVVVFCAADVGKYTHSSLCSEMLVMCSVSSCCCELVQMGYSDLFPILQHSIKFEENQFRKYWTLHSC